MQIIPRMSSLKLIIPFNLNRLFLSCKHFIYLIAIFSIIFAMPMTVTAQDFDQDTVLDVMDIDDDNDGILDVDEGADFARDTDNDGAADYRDIDSDNDGITDNIEAQTTANYVSPLGVVNASGIDVSYGAFGVSPVNTDGDTEPDYIDDDSDNDLVNDVVERGDGQPTSVTSLVDSDGDGLLNIFEGSNVNDPLDVNDENISNAGVFTLGDIDSDTDSDGANAIPLEKDFDYRDNISVNPIIAANDIATNINGAGGSIDILNVLSGDFVNNVSADNVNATLSVATGSTVPPELNFNISTGFIDVLPNTPEGTYSFDYQICETINSLNCVVATATVSTIFVNVDLALNISVSNINPPTGTDITLTIVLTNEEPLGSMDAPEILVKSLLPTGLIYLSDSSGGIPGNPVEYDPITGGWAINSIPAGGSTSIDILATAYGALPLNLTAEVLSTGGNDSDSIPGNGPQMPPEDDEGTVIITPDAGGSPLDSPTGPAFLCETGFYQVFSQQLFLLDPVLGAYDPIGGAGFGYNGTGYNVHDNYIYGIGTSDAARNHLIRVSADGTQQILVDLGHRSVRADMNLLNELIYHHGGSIKAINVSSGQTRVVEPGVPAMGGDFVHKNTGIEGTIIGFPNRTSARIVDLDTGAVLTKSLQGDILNERSNTFGAVWTGLGQRIFLFNNGSGNIYYIDDWETAASPTAIFAGSSASTGGNDGMSCAFAKAPGFPPKAYDDAFSGFINQNIFGDVLTDNGNGQDLDPENTALTVTTIPISGPTNGIITLNPNGTFIYTPNSGYLGTDSFTYEITDADGDTDQATVNITIQQPNIADLSLTKSVNNSSPDSGDNVTFTLVLTNEFVATGSADVTNVVVRDLLPAGLTYVSDNSAASGTNYNSATGDWTISNLAVGASISLDITVATSGSTEITNFAEIITAITDPDSTPNNGPQDPREDDEASVRVLPVTFTSEPTPICTGVNLAVNGGFELPDFTATTFHLVPPDNVPGWVTTDTAIEIWDEGFQGLSALDGDQFVELNAFITGTLTQTSAAHSRAEVLIGFGHRGRTGSETVELIVNDNGGGSANIGQFTTPNDTWSRKTGTYVMSPSSSQIALNFTSIIPATGGVGNFLDNIEYCQTYLTLAKAEVRRTDVDVDGYDSVGDVITYSYTISNAAGNNKPLEDIVITDDKIGTLLVTGPLSGDTNSNGILDVGESWIVEANYTIVQDDIDALEVVNIAFASGSTGINVLRSDDQTVTASLAPLLGTTDMTMSKAFLSNRDEDQSGTVSLGDTLSYSVVALNTGTLDITNVIVTDTLTTPNSRTCPLVQGGQNCTLQGSYVVTAADVAAGSISNTGEVTSSEVPGPLRQTIVTSIGRQYSRLQPDQTESVLACGRLEFEHQLNVSIDDAGLNIVPIALSDMGWSYALYLDVNGNGLEISERINDGTVAPVAGNYTLYAVANVPCDTPAGAIDISSLSLTMASGSAAQHVLTVRNTAYVTSRDGGRLEADKSMSLDADCNGNSDSGLFSTSAGAKPGECIVYRIAMINPGISPITDPIVKDVVPAYTQYLGNSARYIESANLISGIIAAPLAGQTGALSFPFTGPLAGGEQALVQFTVKLEE